jgi:hypothetical protein
MAGTTSNYAFPYPTSGDNIADGATKIQALADSIDTYISGSEAFGKLFDYNYGEDLTSRSTTNCSSTPKAIASSSANFTFTNGKSGVFALVMSGNANNTTTAANGFAIGCRVTIGATEYGNVELSTDVSGTGRGGGSSIKFYDLTAGASVVLVPYVRTILAGGADTIVTYQHKIQVLTMG